MVVSRTDSNRVCLARTGLVLAAGLVLIFSSRPDFAQAAAQDGDNGQPLPPVTVEAPERKPAAQTKPSAQSGDRTAKRKANRRPHAAQAVAAQVPLPATNAQAQSPYGPGVGYVATRSVTATKTNTPILETPQSISVVTRDQISSQGAQNLNEALRYTPGVTLESFGSNTFLDLFKL